MMEAGLLGLGLVHSLERGPAEPGGQQPSGLLGTGPACGRSAALGGPRREQGGHDGRQGDPASVSEPGTSIPPAIEPFEIPDGSLPREFGAAPRLVAPRRSPHQQSCTTGDGAAGRLLGLSIYAPAGIHQSTNSDSAPLTLMVARRRMKPRARWIIPRNVCLSVSCRVATLVEILFSLANSRSTRSAPDRRHGPAAPGRPGRAFAGITASVPMACACPRNQHNRKSSRSQWGASCSRSH